MSRHALKNHWKVFSRFIWISSESFTSIWIQVGSLSENALINWQPSAFALTWIWESVFHLNGKDLNTLGKVVTSENVLNNVIWKCSGNHAWSGSGISNITWTQYIWLFTNRNIWLPSDSVKFEIVLKYYNLNLIWKVFVPVNYVTQLCNNPSKLTSKLSGSHVADAVKIHRRLLGS